MLIPSDQGKKLADHSPTNRWLTLVCVEVDGWRGTPKLLGEAQVCSRALALDGNGGK